MKRLLAFLVSAALLVWLVLDARWRELGAALAQLSPSVALIAAGGFAASYVLRALRVHDEFRADARGRFGTCLRIVLMHNAMINIVPFRGGEAAFPILLGRHFGTPLTRALASLFWFRLQDALVVAVLAAAVWPGLPWWLRVTGIAALISFAWLLPRWARAPHRWSEAGAFARRLAKLRDALADTTRHARYGWMWTISNWAVKLAAQAWLLAALLHADLQTGAAGALGAELAAILPIQGVAGFGTYEAGAAAALLPAGIAFDAGLQAALGLHLFVIGCALAAGALAWLLPATAPRSPGSPNPNS